MATVYITPKPNCRACHGSGTVTDWVPYGMGSTPMESTCDCVTEQLTDEQADDPALWIEIGTAPKGAEYTRESDEND